MTTDKERAMQIAIDFNATYPPHQRHSATSRASAAAAAPKFSSRTHGLLVVIGQYPAGLTDEEGQALMSIDGNSYRPMRVTLMRHGYIEDAGMVRKTKSNRLAVAWQITQAGIHKLKEIG
jgi:hypothetical protein